MEMTEKDGRKGKLLIKIEFKPAGVPTSVPTGAK